MDQTAIQSGLPPTSTTSTVGGATPAGERENPSGRKKLWIMRWLEVVASVRVTVVILAFAIVLVYYGTWAQKESDNWVVVKEYFRSGLVWIPVQVLLMYSVGEIGGSIPFPGGWLLGGFLLVNVLASNVVRFKLLWKRFGILLIHAGLILIMLGEVIAGMYAVEGNMTIVQGKQSDFVEDKRLVEFVVVDRSGARFDREVVVPGQMLADNHKIEDSRLPFDIDVNAYMESIRKVRGDDPNRATVGIGLHMPLIELAQMAAADHDSEYPTAFVTLRKKGTGEILGTYLLSTFFGNFDRPLEEVYLDGKRYCFALRKQREYHNFAVQLLEFKMEVYEDPNTTRPKGYSSKIAVKDPENKHEFEHLIKMNSPLRYNGESYYQSAVYGMAWGTILQVVRNPGYTLPYIACIVVSAGMLLHFGLHLSVFLRRRFQA